LFDRLIFYLGGNTVTHKTKDTVVMAEPEVPLDSPLSQLLLTVTHDKYRMISLATRWAQEIKTRDHSTLPPQEILAQALREIIGKKITMDEIEKLPPPPKTEKKEFEFALPTISLKDKDDSDDEKPAGKKSASKERE